MDRRGEGDTTPWVVVGKIGGAYGVQGYVRVWSFTDPAANLVDYAPWALAIGAGFERVRVDAAELRRKGIIARLGGCRDRASACQHYVGRDIAVPRAALPQAEADEYYWVDLLGLAVDTADGVNLGCVDHLIPTGANDVLVVQGPERQHLVPFVLDRYVRRVDLEARRMIVDWDPDF